MTKELNVLIQSAVFVGNILQDFELSDSVSRIVAPGYHFLRVLVPVEHIVLFKSVLGGPTMVLFHESHHLIILGLPSFVLCHIEEIDAAKITIVFQRCKFSSIFFDLNAPGRLTLALRVTALQFGIW